MSDLNAAHGHALGMRFVLDIHGRIVDIEPVPLRTAGVEPQISAILQIEHAVGVALQIARRREIGGRALAVDRE